MLNTPADDLRELDALVARLRAATRGEPHAHYTYLQKAVYGCLIALSVQLYRMQQAVIKAAANHKALAPDTPDEAVRTETSLALSPLLSHVRDITESVDLLGRLADP